MKKPSPLLSTAAIGLAALAMLATGPADARRGGSFGSRGTRTYSAPRPTSNSGYVAPVQRSMTTRTTPAGAPTYAPGFGAQPRPAGSRFGGFGGGLLGGLVAGGLIGHFFGGGMGGGWGGGGSGGGMLLALLQIAILGGLAWVVIGFFRRRSAGAAPVARDAYQSAPAFAPPPINSPWGSPASYQPAMAPEEATTDIALSGSDQATFEQLLVDVQDAFGREDYGRLRQLTTPEIMSYLSEELSQNATRGVRNEVSGTRLLDAEVSEAWNEASGDYATIAMRYEGIDVMRDRTTGAVVEGSATLPSQTTELWTFVRTPGAPWKLSAIQES